MADFNELDEGSNHSPRARKHSTIVVPLTLLTAFQDLLNVLNIDHRLLRAENSRFVFPSPKALRGLYAHDELYSFLIEKGLVILQDDDRNIRLDLRKKWESRMNHEWHLIIDIRAVEATRFLLRERVHLLYGCVHSLKAEYDVDRGRIRLPQAYDTMDVVRRLNKVLLRELLPLEAIGDSREILFEYRPVESREPEGALA